MIGTGRVWETSAISAPRVITSSTPSASAAVAIVSEKLASAGSARCRRRGPGRGRRRYVNRGQLVLRPLDPTRLAVGEADRRPRRLEVEVVLGVDRAISSESKEAATAPSAVEADAAASFQPKGADHDGGTQMRQVAFPGERIHHLSVEDGVRRAKPRES